MPTLAIGSQVHYDIGGSELRPAIVTKVIDASTANLQVICDGPLDNPLDPDDPAGLLWKGNVVEGKSKGTWRWPA